MNDQFSSNDSLILQLYKWGSLNSQFNLSKFREGFISPTKKLILLLGYDYEALLLPLSEGSNRILSEGFVISGSEDDAPCPSAIVSSSRSCCSSSSSYIHGVNSFAWGVGPPDSSPNELFVEYLFVCCSNGVMVHCFRESDEVSTAPNIIESTGADGSGQGNWINWDDASTHNINDMNKGSFCAGNPKNSENISNVNYISSETPSKAWLRSFFTTSTTVVSEGYVCTNFPGKKAFPCAAKIVSFRILDTDFPFRELFGFSGVAKDEINKVKVKSVSHQDDQSGFSGQASVSTYNCLKIFSSGTYQLIGFYMQSCLDEVNNIVLDSKAKHIVIVARINEVALRWTTVVNLVDYANLELEEDWVDFCFCDNLLICLNANGGLLLCSLRNGYKISYFNVLKASSLNHMPDVEFLEKVYPVAKEEKTENCKVDDEFTNIIGRTRKKRFKKLIISSYYFLLGIVDVNGVIYALSFDAQLSNGYDEMYKFPSCYDCGGSEIGQALKFSSPFDNENAQSNLKYLGFNMMDNQRIMKDRGSRDFGESYLSGFCSSENSPTFRSGSDKNIFRMKSIFLPTLRYSGEECVCLTSFGFTRLVQKRHDHGELLTKVVHMNFRSHSRAHDDSVYNDDIATKDSFEESFVGEAIGCCFQGWFYLVNSTGIYVILSKRALSSCSLPFETIEYVPYSHTGIVQGQAEKFLDEGIVKPSVPTWKLEVVDRFLLYEGHKEADRLFTENGWTVEVPRLRRLQLSLHYLKYDDIEQSLENLDAIDMAEEGILRVLLAVTYLVKTGNDNDVSAASRLLLLITRFAPKVLRRYASIKYCNDETSFPRNETSEVLYLPSIIPNATKDEASLDRRFQELSQYMEMSRRFQYRIDTSRKSSGHELGDSGHSTSNGSLKLKDNQLSVVPSNSLLNGNYLAIVPSNNINNSGKSDDSARDPEFVPQSLPWSPIVFPSENTRDMISRWKLDNLDSKSVVRDALLSGRLPLAVLQLHLHQKTSSDASPVLSDTFNEVRVVGKSVAYDLFLQGETGMGISTLQKLGDDVEACLKQLLFGTLRKSLRIQIDEELRKFGQLGLYDWKILDKALLMERLYPVSKFWRALHIHQNSVQTSTSLCSPTTLLLRLLPSSSLGTVCIECGDVDGVVLGSWTSYSGVCPEVDEDSVCGGYWVAAAVWYNSWDQKTIDRIVLDHPFLMGVHVMWESQLEYFACHDNWDEVKKLVNLIPISTVSSGTLRITLDESETDRDAGTTGEIVEYKNYICSIEEVDVMCLDIPEVRVCKLPFTLMCSEWLKMLMEQELAKNLIFMKEYWEGTTDVVSLFCRSGFICSDRLKDSFVDSIDMSIPGFNLLDLRKPSSATTLAIHKLVVHHCVHYNLPNLLDLYLEYHNLLTNNDSINSLLEEVGDIQWAKWLVLSRVKGREYDASFSNARSIMSNDFVSDRIIRTAELDNIIQTVDDIARRGNELAALATLMYAPSPIQNCLGRGTMRRSNSAMCSFENLRDVLQEFSTLRRTFVSVCKDVNSSYLGSNGYDAISEYLNWRDHIFHSSAYDTSLLEMLPSWMPKIVRRLVQIYIQGPLGWQYHLNMPAGDVLLHREVDFCMHADENTEINSISWEATVQKIVMDELYSPSFKENDAGIEHQLHRGRAFAAFNQILNSRVNKLKAERSSISQSRGQVNVQQDVQILLSPVTDNEEALLSTVIPLAITHFKDSKLVASCAILLELCGMSSKQLHIDIAALRRILKFYENIQKYDNFYPVSPSISSASILSHDIADTLARSLADEYLKSKERLSTSAGQSPSHALVLVLQYLERASLPSIETDNTCGSWLSSGVGDGVDLRFKQKAASKNWNLVTMFCNIHHLPLSTKYLTTLAKDNDWVGFLSEAQTGKHSFETIFQVAANSFSDLRLRTHILNVLKVIQSKRSNDSPMTADLRASERGSTFVGQTSLTSSELFRILADCEKHDNPGEILLKKSKEMSWSVLAMIASCFSDASPVSCLTVWLEITAARETSSIKVNDFASHIGINVGAAVEATNRMYTTNRAISIHFNRTNPKRQRIMDTSPSYSVFPVAENVCDIKSRTTQFLASQFPTATEILSHDEEHKDSSRKFDEELASLAEMVAVLCEQRLFLPLLRAFDMFLPSCSLLPFIRALQAFSQMRLSEASAHLGSFSARLKDESSAPYMISNRDGVVSVSWISSTAMKAGNAVLKNCPSSYERRSLLQLLADTDFADRGAAAANFRKHYIKIILSDPYMQKGMSSLGDELDDVALLTYLERNGQWEEARRWAEQLESNVGTWKVAVHHVTETQAESMVSEWKEFLWDVPEERVALWGHCQNLFIKHSFPPLQAGLFFLKHAGIVEKDVPARELLEILLLSMQWLSGMISESYPVYSMYLLREMESRIWLLAVESDAQIKSDRGFTSPFPPDIPITDVSYMIEKTAAFIAKMDHHVSAMKLKYVPVSKNQSSDGNWKTKRRIKIQQASDGMERIVDMDEEFQNDIEMLDDNLMMEVSISKWGERLGPEELKRAVLSLLEFGQIAASKQLQFKLSPTDTPLEFKLVDAALHFASVATNISSTTLSMLNDDVTSVLKPISTAGQLEHPDPLQILETLASTFSEGSGRGLCKRIIAVVKAANALSLSFSEAYNTQPIELFRLLSLKAQDSYEEAALLIQTHTMPAACIAQVLAESFLKGLLAAHRGGYIDSQTDEGPSPLLWRFSDFLKWAEFCPSHPEVGHALMRLVVTGQDIPNACEVELLILSHHLYKSSACLDGVDVLADLATTRVETYVSDGDFSCLARLITGVGNFHSLNFILNILIDNGKLDLLLHKYSIVAETADSVRNFRMAVLTSLDPKDLDAFAMVYGHFDMKHETATLLESRAWRCSQRWFERSHKDRNEDLLNSMRYFVESAEVYSSIDAGNKTHRACAQASLVSLQIRIPDSKWLNLSETNARRLLVEQSRFQEALIVAEAYALNQPSEWAPVLWNQMQKPDMELYVADYVAVLPLQASMLTELARYYKADVAARSDQSQFAVWLSGGGGPAEWGKYLGKSFRCLLEMTRDLRLRVQLAVIATGFADVLDASNKLLDKVPDNAGPLVLRKGHGGAYLPLM